MHAVYARKKMHSALLVFFLIINATRANELCSTASIDRGWSQYVTTPPPGVFEGQSTEGPGCVNGTCLGPSQGGTGRLGDQDLGEQSFNERFVGHAWDQTVSIEFIFEVFTPIISGINLYFYNIPSERIGLPYNIKITSEHGEHQYLLQGNNNLTQEDSGLQSVTLTPQLLSLPNNRFTIVFEFHKIGPITCLLLTEVEICTSPTDISCIPPPIFFSLGSPNTIAPANTSVVRLTCSVTEGRFNWTWTGPMAQNSALTTQQLVLNAGRTSVLELSGLSSEDEGTYKCQATHTFGTMASVTFDIQLILQGTLQAESEVVEVDPCNETTAILKCFLFGYLSSRVEPTINWKDANMNQLTADLGPGLVYMIDHELGDMLIQNGGARPVPSLTSTLTVYLTSSLLTTSQQYSCSSGQIKGLQSINLTMLSNCTTPPPPPPLNIFIPIGVACGAIVLFIATLVVTIIVRHTRIKHQENGDDPIQIEENEAHTTLNAFDMTQNTTYDTGHAEELTEEDVEHEYEDLSSITVIRRMSLS